MPSPINGAHTGGRGTVVAFEQHRGLGTVEDTAGRQFDFHCTVIDGSRSIAVGTPVVFAVAPGRVGRYEAVAVIALG